MFSEEDEVLTALKGGYPCEGCNLSIMGDDHCANEDNCEAWLIFSENIEINEILHALIDQEKHKNMEIDTDSDLVDILRERLLSSRKTIIKVYADPYLTRMHDDKDSQQNLACEVIEKLGKGNTFSINGIKIGFIPSKFIDNPQDIDMKEQTEIDGDNFEFVPDEHKDKYEIEWIFANSKLRN